MSFVQAQIAPQPNGATVDEADLTADAWGIFGGASMARAYVQRQTSLRYRVSHDAEPDRWSGMRWVVRVLSWEEEEVYYITGRVQGTGANEGGALLSPISLSF